jgi:hypothetical protein
MMKMDSVNINSSLGTKARIHQGFWGILFDGAITDNKPNVQVSNPELYNYPNPFSLSTTIYYFLPGSSHVTLRIYDIKGNIVRLLADEYQDAGEHRIQWDGKDANGVELSNGSYVYDVIANPAQLAGDAGFNSFRVQNMMVLVK